MLPSGYFLAVPLWRDLIVVVVVLVVAIVTGFSPPEHYLGFRSVVKSRNGGKGQDGHEPAPVPPHLGNPVQGPRSGQHQERPRAKVQRVEGDWRGLVVAAKN